MGEPYRAAKSKCRFHHNPGIILIKTESLKIDGTERGFSSKQHTDRLVICIWKNRYALKSNTSNYTPGELNLEIKTNKKQKSAYGSCIWRRNNNHALCFFLTTLTHPSVIVWQVNIALVIKSKLALKFTIYMSMQTVLVKITELAQFQLITVYLNPVQTQ